MRLTSLPSTTTLGSATNTIESTSPLANLDTVDPTTLPAVLVPSEPPAPDAQYEQRELKERIRRALATLPARERRLISLYYFRGATMKQIGKEIGVNESRVSQLHARAMSRLRKAMSPTAPAEVVPFRRQAVA